MNGSPPGWTCSNDSGRTGKSQGPTTEENGVDVVLLDLGRFGSWIARELRQRGYRMLGVDIDPELVRRREGDDYAVRYGDAEDPVFLATLPLGQVRWVLSSVREKPVNLAFERHIDKGR